MAGTKLTGPNNVIRIDCNKDNVFRYWLEFLTPIHHLTDREIDVAAAFLRERHRLSKVILDPKILDSTLMGSDTQEKLRRECGVNNQHFQVIKSKLKSKGFFQDGKIYDKLIPSIKEEEDTFLVILYFNIEDVKK